MARTFNCSALRTAISKSRWRETVRPVSVATTFQTYSGESVGKTRKGRDFGTVDVATGDLLYRSLLVRADRMLRTSGRPVKGRYDLERYVCVRDRILGRDRGQIQLATEPFFAATLLSEDPDLDLNIRITRARF